MKKRAKQIQKILNELFPDPEIPLYHLNPYTLLIAVLLSAQTTDKQVNVVTQTLFKRAKTPEEMLLLSPHEIQKIIQSVGLAPKKARYIHELSSILVKKYKGEVPKTLAALEKLPGVGHKTASVVMIQAFGKPAFPVDTHIHRLAKRWGLSSGKNVLTTERDLKKCFPKKSWAKVHLQMIFFGRTYCPALKHERSACPICSWCVD